MNYLWSWTFTEICNIEWREFNDKILLGRTILKLSKKFEKITASFLGDK